MISSIDLVQNLDEFRIKEKLTIENFCDGVMSRKKFTRLLNGEADITFEEIIHLTAKLSMTFQEFYLYIVNKVEGDNSWESSFYLSVIAGDYETAYNTYYPFFKTPTGVGLLSKRGLPALIELTKFKLNKQDKYLTLSNIRLLTPLKDVIDKTMVDDDTLLVLYAYSFLSEGKTLRLIINYLVRLTKDQEVKFLFSFSEQSFNLLYNLGVKLHKELAFLTKEDEANLWTIMQAALKYQTKSRIIKTDHIFFKNLYELLLQQKRKNRYVSFYYIATYLSQPQTMRGALISVDEEDIRFFEELLADNTFIYSPMYEGLINGDKL